MFRELLPLLVLLVLVALTATGCVAVPASTPTPLVTATPGVFVVSTPTPAAAAPALQTATPTPAAPAEGGLRPIPVSNVTVDVGVGSPIPVDAFVSGEWPDLCAQLAQVIQRFEGNTIEITLLATAADPACPPDNLGLPFRIAIPINVVQLAEATYTVTANGATTTFTVPVTSPAVQPTMEPPATTPGTAATVEVPATLPPAPTVAPPAATPAPTVTAAVTPAATTVAGGVLHYQGPNPYRATPRFDVAYDALVWQYVEDDGSGRQSQLKHTSMPGCAVWLRAGPVGSTPVATVWLAEREWTIAQVQPNIIQYSAAQGDISWIFGVLLSETYSGRGNSNCQDAAERVIDTFTVLTQ